MNRRERRWAAALNRSRRVGYLHRVMAAIANGVTPLRLGLHITSIKHDPGWPHPIAAAAATACRTFYQWLDGGVTVIDGDDHGVRSRKR